MNILKRLGLFAMLFLAIGCGKKSTNYWKEEIKSPDSSKRLHAVYALQDRVKEPKVVVPILADALNDEDTFIRRDAARALGKFGPAAKEAVPALVARLNDQEPSVRKAAATALKLIDPTALALKS